MKAAEDYVRQWLKDNDMSEAQLSIKAGKNRRYVSNWFAGNSGEWSGIFALHPIVNFPPKIMRAAEKGRAYTYKERGLAISESRRRNKSKPSASRTEAFTAFATRHNGPRHVSEVMQEFVENYEEICNGGGPSKEQSLNDLDLYEGFGS